MSMFLDTPSKLKPARKVIFSIESPPDAIIRTRFEKDFDVIRVIGSGNFGKVYECRNILDQLTYAIKVTNNAVNKSQIQHSLNEAVALASVGALNNNNSLSSWGLKAGFPLPSLIALSPVSIIS